LPRLRLREKSFWNSRIQAADGLGLDIVIVGIFVPSAEREGAHELFIEPEFTDKVPEMKTPRGQAGAVLASSAWSRVAAPIFTSQVSFHG
jgi:hypothetical protein